MGAFSPTTWIDRALPKLLASQLNRMESGINIANAPLVSSLPGSPVDGQEVYYVADAAAGVVWHLVYRSADTSTTKWQFVGGSPLWAEVDSYQATTSNTYGNLTTTGPQVTCPLAGDYMVRIEAELGANNGVCAAIMSYAIGGTAASDNDCIYGGTTFTSPSTEWQSSREKRKTGLAASTVLLTKYKSSVNGTNAAFTKRGIFAVPVRVG